MIREMLGIAEGILQDLHNDHSKGDELLADIMESENGADRGRLFSELRIKLLAHLKAEEEVLYQRMDASQDEETRQFSHEGVSEHEIIERQLQKLSDLGNRMSDEWTAELKVLQDLVEHHVDEEESTGFSCARSMFEKDELEAMGRSFEARKAALMAGIV